MQVLQNAESTVMKHHPCDTETLKRKQEVGEIGEKIGTDVEPLRLFQVPGGGGAHQKVGEGGETSLSIDVEAGVVWGAAGVVDRHHASQNGGSHSGACAGNCLKVMRDF